MTFDPRCSVVIPVRDDPRLDMAVSSVVDQQGLSTPAEVIVVDNGSREPVTNRWGPGVRVLSERRPGSYAARNAGVLASTGEVIAFLDSDCVATPTWIRNGVAGCARDSIAVGTVRVSTRSDPTLAERFDVEYAFPQDAYFAEGWGVTANLFVGRGVFDEVGLFDKELLSGGDRDFCLRARDRGVELHRVETAVVVHPARATIRELVRKRMRVESANATRRSREVGVLRTAFDAVALARPPVRGLLRGGRVDLLAVEWLLRIFGAAAWLRSTPGARVHE